MIVIKRYHVIWSTVKCLQHRQPVFPRLTTVIHRSLCHQLLTDADLSVDEKITKTVRSSHGILYDHHLPTFISVCKQIQDAHQLEDDVVIRSLNKQPTLVTYSAKQWLNCVENLLGNGLDIKTIFAILSKCPTVLQVKPQRLDEVFNSLRVIGLAGKHLKHVISGAPTLLITEPKFIDNQWMHLMYLFPQGDLKKLIWMCPNLLFDGIEDTEAKLMFVVHEMRVKHEAIASSSVLALTLGHIRKRFELLVRTGYYRKAHPKLTVNNPSLEEMMETPLRELVEKKVGISWEEYLTFEKMYDREMERQRQNSDDEDDSDEEDT